MKLLVGLAVLISVIAFAAAGPECKVPLDKTNFPEDWINMQSDCVSATKTQIKAEIGASYTYLQMAAHFARDTVNRPGFAEFFFNAAKEEREHAIQLMEYLSMRGDLVSGFEGLTVPEYLQGTWAKSWNGGIEALTDALKLETLVTENIRKLIVKCEKPDATDTNNDYHFVDYLTGVYLEEQYKGQRDIAGKLATLKKMYKSQGHLAEFLFDKEL